MIIIKTITIKNENTNKKPRTTQMNLTGKMRMFNKKEMTKLSLKHTINKTPTDSGEYQRNSNQPTSFRVFKVYFHDSFSTGRHFSKCVSNDTLTCILNKLNDHLQDL